MTKYLLYSLAIMSGLVMQYILASASHLLGSIPEAGLALANVTLVLPIWAHLLLMTSLLWWGYLEELIFRGWLWRRISNRLGENIAWAGTSISFAAVHLLLSLHEAILLLPLSIVLGAWRKAYGPKLGVMLCVCCHVAFSMSGILISLF